MMKRGVPKMLYIAEVPEQNLSLPYLKLAGIGFLIYRLISSLLMIKNLLDYRPRKYSHFTISSHALATL
jgi:hypothetical protein